MEKTAAVNRTESKIRDVGLSVLSTQSGAGRTRTALRETRWSNKVFKPMWHNPSVFLTLLIYSLIHTIPPFYMETFGETKLILKTQSLTFKETYWHEKNGFFFHFDKSLTIRCHTVLHSGPLNCITAIEQHHNKSNKRGVALFVLFVQRYIQPHP